MPSIGLRLGFAAVEPFHDVRSKRSGADLRVFRFRALAVRDVVGRTDKAAFDEPPLSRHSADGVFGSVNRVFVDDVDER